MEIQPASETMYFFKKLDKVKKRRFFSVTLIPTLIYHLTTHDDLAMQAMVWPFMVRFRVIWFGAVRFSASYMNLR
jgi:hypothetical protein